MPLPNNWDEIGGALTCKVDDDMCRKMDVFVSETSCLVDGWMHALDDMSACAVQCAHLATNASFIWGNTNMTS